MRTVSVSTMRELDRRTIDVYEVPGSVLMDRAGAGLARAIQRLLVASRVEPDVLMIAGKGNNGGDVFAAAGYLREWGCRLDVRLAGRVADLKGDALLHCRKMVADGIPCSELPDEDDWTRLHLSDEFFSVVVDGLLGTGATGAPRGTVAAAIKHINQLAKKAYVVAIDIPSGVNGDSGATEGAAVVADLTVTMAAPKQGFLNPKAHALLGAVDVVDIGVPTELSDALCDAEPDLELIVAQDLQPLLKRREAVSHKGRYGHAMLVGGARGYSGAITMALHMACRSGCGLVSAMVPAGIAGRVAGSVLEAMVMQDEANAAGALCGSEEGLAAIRDEAFTAILLGPGMTPHEDTRRMVDEVIHSVTCPVVLDADALNVFAGEIEVLKGSMAPLVLTPHPGELARLLNVETSEVQKDRLSAARTAASLSGAVVVLKGCGTLVAREGDPVGLNLTGNPGMARGGSGDVLAGLVTGFCAQGLEPRQAACAAVYLHGLAGDYAAWKYGQRTMRTMDIIDALPVAIRHADFR